MLLFIIFSIFLLVGLVFLILGCKEKFHTSEGDETSMFIGGILIGINGLFLCVCGIIAIIANACPQIQLNEWEEKIVFLQNDKEKLESYHLVTDDNGKTTFTSDITLETISTNKYYEMVDNYNKEVKDFKIDMRNGKVLRKNIWINCFTWAAYESFDLTLLDSLEYTTGK